jgi:hypothetical protein
MARSGRGRGEPLQQLSHATSRPVRAFSPIHPLSTRSGETIGTLWAVAHDPQRKFDAADARQYIRTRSPAAASWSSRTIARSRDMEHWHRSGSKQIGRIRAVAAAVSGRLALTDQRGADARQGRKRNWPWRSRRRRCVARPDRSEIEIGIVFRRRHAGQVIGQQRPEARSRLDARIPLLGRLVRVPGHVSQVIEAG